MSQMIDTCHPHFVVLWVSPASHAALVWALSSDVSVYGLCVASVAISMNSSPHGRSSDQASPSLTVAGPLLPEQYARLMTELSVIPHQLVLG